MRAIEVTKLQPGSVIARNGENFSVLHVHPYEEGDAVAFCTKSEDITLKVYDDPYAPSNLPQGTRVLCNYRGADLRVEFLVDPSSASTVDDCEVVSAVNAHEWEVV